MSVGSTLGAGLRGAISRDFSSEEATGLALARTLLERDGVRELGPGLGAARVLWLETGR